MHRARLVRSPAYRLVTQEGLEAVMGRYSAFNIYFGFGQKILLPWGGRWRLTAVQQGRLLCPVVANEERRRLAMAAANLGSYGINGRDYAYTLNPAEASWGRAGCWDLFEGDDFAARLRRHPFTARCDRPVPLPALLLALLLARFGIPGEGTMQPPPMRWD